MSNQIVNNRYDRSNRKSNIIYLTLLVLVLVIITLFAQAPGAHAETECFEDAQGPNDHPGQKDLTYGCIDDTNAPESVDITWQWDETGWSGKNTGDACVLFDTDTPADGLVNTAACLSVGQDPAEIESLEFYSCTNTAADKCANPRIMIPATGESQSTCTLSIEEADPFDSSFDNGPGDDHPYDTVARCTIDLGDVGGQTATTVDVCSLPSSNPNSASSDCIVGEITYELGPASQSPFFMQATAPDGTSIDFMVSRTIDGIPTSLDWIIVKDPLEEFPTTIEIVDETTRKIRVPTGEMFEITTISDTQYEIRATSADGQIEETVLVDVESGNATPAIQSYSLPTELDSEDCLDQPNLNVDKTSASKVNNASVSNSLGNRDLVFPIYVTKCGLGYDTYVFLKTEYYNIREGGKMKDLVTYIPPDKVFGDGLYAATVPMDQAKAQDYEWCQKGVEFVSDLGCKALEGGMQISCTAFINPAFVLGCEIAAKALGELCGIVVSVTIDPKAICQEYKPWDLSVANLYVTPLAEETWGETKWIQTEDDVSTLEVKIPGTSRFGDPWFGETIALVESENSIVPITPVQGVDYWVRVPVEPCAPNHDTYIIKVEYFDENGAKLDEGIKPFEPYEKRTINYEVVAVENAVKHVITVTISNGEETLDQISRVVELDPGGYRISLYATDYGLGTTPAGPLATVQPLKDFYSHGEVVTLSAHPYDDIDFNDGYSFQYWFICTAGYEGYDWHACGPEYLCEGPDAFCTDELSFELTITSNVWAIAVYIDL